MTRARLAIAAVLVLALMAGCEDGHVEPTPKDTTKVTVGELDTARGELLDDLGKAVTSASTAAGGQKVRTADEVTSTVCDAIYPRRFRYVEVSGAFVVPGADRATVVGSIRDAWASQGWEPKVGGKQVAGEDDQVTVTTKTSGGIPATIRAVVLEGTSGQAVANIDIRTSCLELPQVALDSLDEWQDDLR